MVREMNLKEKGRRKEVEKSSKLGLDLEKDKTGNVRECQPDNQKYRKYFRKKVLQKEEKEITNEKEILSASRKFLFMKTQKIFEPTYGEKLQTDILIPRTTLKHSMGVLKKVSEITKIGPGDTTAPSPSRWWYQGGGCVKERGTKDEMNGN